jgi:glucose-6-phosphate 1-dehydrogenase
LLTPPLSRSFALYYEGTLPADFAILGFARSAMSDAQFRDSISDSLTCRVAARENCAAAQAEFLARCFYCQGQYDEPASFVRLSQLANALEGEHAANRIFYLSIPPSVFVPVAQNAARHAASANGYTRVIVEKPFGRDLESSRALDRSLAEALSEEQIYRIDHYLGKELIENLTVLRFSNLVFQPLWNRQFIKDVQIIWSENFGVEGRGGYFKCVRRPLAVLAK